MQLIIRQLPNLAGIAGHLTLAPPVLHLFVETAVATGYLLMTPVITTLLHVHRVYNLEKDSLILHWLVPLILLVVEVEEAVLVILLVVAVLLVVVIMVAVLLVPFLTCRHPIMIPMRRHGVCIWSLRHKIRRLTMSTMMMAISFPSLCYALLLLTYYPFNLLMWKMLFVL
jgi:hypothetical protein